ncbi:Dsl1-C domain-containing protein [Mycena venus]|uniref:Dsl1-C domain-containing protein n=1 Tax=Mycena venus TaxID=2733690 RepID=A0A8H6YCK4_9AGAR|nr:Dsl1-C domain-containing protein [Mycena venus]
MVEALSRKGPCDCCQIWPPNTLLRLDHNTSAMAFPVPSHLPRRPNPQDVSSEILMKIDQATNQTLTASLATSWLAELEDTIRATETHIHDRIHLDLPQFEQQLESSKSVQTRLQSLVSNVDELNQTLSDPGTGLIPILVRSLTTHATLAQESADATVRHETLSHLLRCRAEFGSVLSLVQMGKLPQAVEACGKFDQLLQNAPAHLHQTNVMLDIKRKFQAAKSRAEEQLSEAYSRSVTVSPKCLTILSSVAVRQSETVLSLSEVLSSLSATSLSSHLTTLRRDTMAHYVDHVLRQPTSLTISCENAENRLTLFPSPPNSEDLTTRLDNVSATLKFMSTHFTAFLPPSESLAFSRSLCKPIVTSVLSNLLVPSLPSSFDLLPQFIGLSKQAVAFEEECVIQLLGDDKSDRLIKAWVDGMGGHYERQRRLQILDTSRVIILSPESADDRFLVEIDIRQGQDKAPEVVPVQEEDPDASWGLNGSSSSSEAVDDGWGFEDDTEPESESASAATSSIPAEDVVAEDSWGFDDEEEDGTAPVVEPQEPPDANGLDKPDDDAWGWNDEAPADPAEETAWDDPWDEPPAKSSAVVESRPPPAPSIGLSKASISSPASTSSPKMATRLEKLANKGKKHLNGNSPMSSPALSTPMSSAKPSPAPPSPPPPAPANPSEKRPPRLTPAVVPKETYLVSGRMRQIINIVEDVLAEGQKFAASKILPPIETSSSPGTVLLQSAASILDLYRALYPVKFAGRLKTAPEAPMLFSNDCLYLSGEIARMEAAAASQGSLAPVRDRLVECRTRLKIVGDSWFEDTVEQHRQSANDIISQGAEGFTFTADQDRYDECETAISRVVQEIKRLAQQWKGILNKNKYYTAVGMVTEAALSRVLEDILALPDIPEVESHRLSELCRMLHALEALFIEDQDPFVVAYVPSWLKFSYLSELLEASMVDISYLFDSGALVDFEVDELVRLVRALFADTALRTNTINKLTAGRQ